MQADSAEKHVKEARTLRHPPGRAETARKRALSALQTAQHHERQALAARERLKVICRTWEIDASSL